MDTDDGYVPARSNISKSNKGRGIGNVTQIIWFDVDAILKFIGSYCF
jgi:hypothetical protein